MRRRVESVLAAGDGRAFGSRRQAAAVSALHGVGDSFCLSSFVLAGERTVIFEIAERRTLAFVSVWRLQRRDDRLSDGDHAREGAHRGILARVQSSNGNLWRFYP